MGTFIKKKTAFSEEVGISRKTISKNFVRVDTKLARVKSITSLKVLIYKRGNKRNITTNLEISNNQKIVLCI